jgi:AraC family transcriptional regulator of adaptative response/methylated-DNA-[protein]-cysteine methyltransferase
MVRFTASLKRGETVRHATDEAGFGSSSGLYARVHTHLGMTPSAFRSGGMGVTRRYTKVPTPVVRMLVAVTEGGIAAVSLGDSEAALVTSLHNANPKAVFHRDRKGLEERVPHFLQCFNGRVDMDRPLLDVMATVFQRKVWQALRQIPRGQTRSHQEIARAIERPTAARALARACGTNPVAVAIPCHRVVRGSGQLAGYRCDLGRKQRLLALERM